MNNGNSTIAKRKSTENSKFFKTLNPYIGKKNTTTKLLLFSFTTKVLYHSISWILMIYTRGSFKSNLVRYYHIGILYKKNHYGVDNITVVMKKTGSGGIV